MISKLPSYGFYPSICAFISSFLSGRSIAAVVDGHCSSSKPINSGVPQGSVLSPTLFLPFINDFVHYTSITIHSYVDDSTFHFSINFSQRPSQQVLQQARYKAMTHLIPDMVLISESDKINPVDCKTPKA